MIPCVAYIRCTVPKPSLVYADVQVGLMSIIKAQELN